MRNAIIYARISQDRQGAGLGVDRQLVECQEYARAHDLRVIETLTDNDISAYSGKRRPGYQELLSRIREGRTEVVLVWHTDRLHRSPKELEEYIDACETGGVQTLTVKAGKLDLATPHGRLIARSLGNLARYESEHKGERIKAKRRQAALAGVWQGGARPFGWEIVKETDEHGQVRNVPVLKEDEAQLVRWAFQAVLEGKSISAIVAHFQRSGVPSVRGNGWRHSTVRSLFSRTRNCGIESLEGEEMGPSSFPAIVDEGTFRAVQAILKRPERKTQDDNRVKYLLSGIARCHCGELMVAGKSTGKSPHPIYVCVSGRFPATRRRDVAHVVRRVEDMDERVENAMPQFLSLGLGSFVVRAAASAEDIQAVETELVKLRAKREDLMDMWKNDVLTTAQFSSLNTDLTADIEAAEQKIAAVAAQGHQMPVLQVNQAQAFWDDLDLPGKREVLKAAVSITCFPTGGRNYRRLENKHDYMSITGKPIEEGAQRRVVHWTPTVEPEYDEDPAD
ncbi:recombinase family protein [Kocuria sabuli]|uniref:recombinase family protein n=1 Tax=Kocuria sabuli TaxID=3071448 RepID=UPI0034D52760